MESRGRPRGFESRRRTKELVRLVSIGTPLVVAARESGVKPARVLRLLDDPAFFDVVVAAKRSGLAA